MQKAINGRPVSRRACLRGYAVVCGAFALAACAGTAMPDAAGDSRAALDRDVPALLAKYNIPSVSVAKIEGGRLVFAAAYGEQSAGVPATPRSLYNIASMSKPISAEVILRLVAQRQVSLDEPMSHYWTDPDIASDPRREQLTPRLALSHQTGFANWRRQTGGVLTFQRAPGEAFGYSGEGYEYVARFAQKKTATDFETLAQTLVFGPAGMRETAYTRRPWFDGRIAVPNDASGTPLPPAIADRFIASDEVYATAADYARFLVSVMKHQGVSEAIAKERETIQVSRRTESCAHGREDVCPQDIGMGLGWEVYRFSDDILLMHTGVDKGVFTFGYFSPSHRRGCVIFTNSANGAHIVLPILERLHAHPGFVTFLRRVAGE